MGFRLSQWDEKLLNYSHLFEARMMDLEVNCSIEEALNIGWKTLGECFEAGEVGIKEKMIRKILAWQRLN